MSSTLEGPAIIEQMQLLCRQIAQLDEDEAIEVINQVKLALHEVSPMRNEPVDCVLWVPAETVEGNAYNPNHVAPAEMRLLEHSILMDGYTQPIVTWPVEGHREVVDGFHRNLAGKKNKAIKARVRGWLPITTINADRAGFDDRMAATIRHNRARGRHGVEDMGKIVLDLARRNHNDLWIGRELGMDPDEVLRLKQLSGLAEMFADREFSEAWEITDDTTTEATTE